MPIYQKLKALDTLSVNAWLPGEVRLPVYKINLR